MSNLFGLAALCRLEEKDLLLHDGVVLKHGEGTMHTRANHCAIIARHGHGNEPDGNGARLRCKEKSCQRLSEISGMKVLEPLSLLTQFCTEAEQSFVCDFKGRLDVYRHTFLGHFVRLPGKVDRCCDMMEIRSRRWQNRRGHVVGLVR